MKMDMRGRKRKRGGSERDTTTRLFSRRNIAPASECVRNRADCNSVGMDGNREKRAKKKNEVALSPDGINLALLLSAIQLRCVHTIPLLLGHNSRQIVRFARRVLRQSPPTCD